MSELVFNTFNTNPTTLEQDPRDGFGRPQERTPRARDPKRSTAVHGSSCSAVSRMPRSFPSLALPLGVKDGSAQRRTSPCSSALTTTSSPLDDAATAVTGVECAGTHRSNLG